MKLHGALFGRLAHANFIAQIFIERLQLRGARRDAGLERLLMDCSACSARMRRGYRPYPSAPG